MARLAAREKVLFYPTPLEIVELIANNIVAAVENSPDARFGNILDPCCGTGEPLAFLGNHLGLLSYGNELHPQRFAQVEPRLDHCLNGAREFLEVESQFNVVFDNPPYDQALGGQRMEVEHLRHDLELLAVGGLAIWVIPETIIDFELCSWLASNFREVNIRRFPEPEYDRFKQVVVFGIKREGVVAHTYTTANNLEQLVKQGPSVLRAGEFSYSYTTTGDAITHFALGFPEASTLLAEVEEHGLQTGESWQSLFSTQGTGFDHFQPVLRLTSGHTAFVIAAGIVDGTEVEMEGQPHIIKGSTGKRVTVTQETEQSDEGMQKTIREREKLVQTITAFNLADGSLTEYNSLDDKDGFAQFLLEHQEVLVRTIDQTYAPLFDPERDMPRWLPWLERIRAPGALPGQQGPGSLLPAQQVRAAALATRLQTAKGVIGRIS